jgi:hypothetical protein
MKVSVFCFIAAVAMPGVNSQDGRFWFEDLLPGTFLDRFDALRNWRLRRRDREPWRECPSNQRPDRVPSSETVAYSAVDARNASALFSEILDRVEQINELMRRAQGREVGPVVEFTGFTGCPDGEGQPSMMLEIKQQQEEAFAPDSFFDVWIEIGDDGGIGGGSGGGGGGNPSSGGCHCDDQQVSCQGPCPC